MTRRVLVLADEANVMAGFKMFGKRLDWLKIRDYVANPGEGRELVEFVLYAGLPPAMPGYQEQRQRKEAFLQWAEHAGFLVVRRDGNPTEGGHFKANVDVLMAIDAVDLAVQIKPEIVVLMTGDADFAHLAMTLRRRGIRIEVAAVATTLGTKLRAAANRVLDLTPLINSFDSLGGEPPPPAPTPVPAPANASEDRG